MPTKFAMRLLAGTAVSALLTGASIAAEAQARPFDIPQQDAATALQAFAMQSGRQVLFPYEAAKGKQAPEVKGDYSDEEVIALLAASAGLKVTADDGRTVTLRPQFAQAAEAGGGNEVDTLVVTAQKREEDIQDVPIAISAFTQEALERSQIAGGPDLITQVPNMTFTKTNFSSYSIQLRGIGTQAISATTDAAVAVAFNNQPFIRNRFFEQEFYDLQRIEVLRGPQGTLYGRNATAGVVNVISQKPKFSYEAKLSADVANYNSTRLEGMINIPLADDVAALRIAGAWTKRDGYAFNQITGHPIDGRDLRSTRVSLRFTPTGWLDANLIWEHFEEDDDRLRSGKQLCHRHAPTELFGRPIRQPDGTNDANAAMYYLSQGCIPASLYAPESFEAPNGFALPYYHALSALSFYDVPGLDPYVSTTQSRNLRVIESTLTPEYRAKTDLLELQFNVDVSDSLILTSETGYGTDRLFSFQDYNRFNTNPGAWRTDVTPGQSIYRENLIRVDGSFCDPQLGCADRLVAGDVSTAKSVQFSQEFRLSSDYDGPFNFSLGANFLRYDTEDKYYVFINALTLFAASRGRPVATRPPWIVGEADNLDCMGSEVPDYPDPNIVNPLIGCIYIDPNPISSLNDEGHNYFLSKNPYKLISYAVFGESYYNITENLKITAGLRWTVDKKEAPRVPSWVLAANTVGYPVADVSEQEWREPTGRLTIDWKPELSFTNETLIYGSYAHGYKAGGANPPAAGIVLYVAPDAQELAVRRSVTKPKTFDPEFIDAFELGAKNTLLNGALNLNMAAFYYDYKDYQISYITDRSAVNLNFDAEVWGLEIEADWRPLDNLRFGLKGGYEDTEVAHGERAVDVMDRTAGREGWTMVRPHPSGTNNCILPEEAFDPLGAFIEPPNPVGTAGATACEIAWLLNQPLNGWDPIPWIEETNNGEGFFKDLSGNELPNAPHYTATLTADYTIPLPNDWLATLHTDLYYQSEAWTRIFNTEGYDKLKAYTNVNLAAIFTNDEAGWKVMAYVKNVFDRDSITGAFLNSDDTGLTTNVFLTEPRLYGLRVTKDFSGGPWWTGANPAHEGPYPLTVEISGQAQRHDAPYASLTPSFADEFDAPINTIGAAQHNDLDWGDGRTLKVTYRPGSSPWTISAAVRYGRTNGSGPKVRAEQANEPVCGLAGPFASACLKYPGTLEEGGLYFASVESSRSSSVSREQHDIVDFAVGRDVQLGGLEGRVSAGLRHASLESSTDLRTFGSPHFDVPAGWYAKYSSTRDFYKADLTAQREFEGTGPVLTWDGAAQLLGDAEMGRVTLDWSVAGGVLFGQQETTVSGEEQHTHYVLSGLLETTGGVPIALATPVTTPVGIRRTDDVTAPLIDLSLGLSYEVGRMKVGAGYRWERYFDVLDVGYDEEQDADRTIDGPYFKLSVGFGG